MNEGIDIYGNKNDINVIQEISTPIVIGRIIDEVGVRKSALPVFKTYTLAILAGALGCVVLVKYAGIMALSNGGVADTAVAIAKAGIALPSLDALLRGL